MLDLLQAAKNESTTDARMFELVDAFIGNEEGDGETIEMRVHYKHADGSVTPGEWAETAKVNAGVLAQIAERFMTDHDVFTVELDNVIAVINTDHLASIAIEVGKTEEPELDLSFFAR